MSRKLPRIEVKPVVRHFDLIAIYDLLLEDSIAISETISPGWVVERCERIQETGSQSTKTAITKSSIVLLLDDIFDTEAKICETLCVEISSEF